MAKIPREKKYVGVKAKFAEDGNIFPESILFDDDTNADPPREFIIDRIVGCQKSAAIEVGGAGMRYTVMIGGSQSYLYLEPDGYLGRWFVEAKKV